MRPAWIIAVLVIGASFARGGEDTDVRRARALYETGTKRYQLGEYKDALASFREAYMAKRSPAFLFNIGQCHRMLHQHEESARAYRAYLRESPDAPNRGDVEEFIRAAEEALKPGAGTLPSDGTGTGLPGNPATAPRPGGTGDTPAERGAAPKRPIAGIALASVGGAIAIGGAAVFAAGTVSSDGANGAPTLGDRNAQILGGQRMNLAGAVLMGAGGAAVVASIVLLALPRKKETRTTYWLAPAVNGIMAGGTF